MEENKEATKDSITIGKKLPTGVIIYISIGVLLGIILLYFRVKPTPETGITGLFFAISISLAFAGGLLVLTAKNRILAILGGGLGYITMIIFNMTLVSPSTVYTVITTESGEISVMDNIKLYNPLKVKKAINIPRERTFQSRQNLKLNNGSTLPILAIGLYQTTEAGAKKIALDKSALPAQQKWFQDTVSETITQGGAGQDIQTVLEKELQKQDSNLFRLLTVEITAPVPPTPPPVPPWDPSRGPKPPNYPG